MLLHQHHGVPYSGIPWFNNVPIQQLVNGIINDATLVGANLAGGLGEQARVVVSGARDCLSLAYVS